MNIRVLNVPYDSGQYRARMGCGPARLFEFGLKPLLTRLGHNFVMEEITAPDSYLAEIKTAFALCRTVADRSRLATGRLFSDRIVGQLQYRSRNDKRVRVSEYGRGLV
jgi:hypothetical protein